MNLLGLETYAVLGASILLGSGAVVIPPRHHAGWYALPMAAMRRLAVVLASLSSCSASAFVCEQDADCRSGDSLGICQPEQRCSFPDEGCASGQRFGDHAGDLSGTCVPVDTGSDASTTAAADGVGPTSAGDPSSGQPGTTLAIDDSSGGTSTTTTSGAATSTTTGEGPDTTTGAPDDPDLLLWLRFEDDGEAGLVNEGALGGAATCEMGCPIVADGLASFDGIDDCLVLPNGAALASESGTAAMWLWRLDDVEAFYYSFLSKAFADDQVNSWELYLLTDSVPVPLLRAQIGAGPNATVQVEMPTALVWMHVAATWDGATLELWVDGRSVGQADAPSPTFDDHPVQLACDDNGLELAGHLGGWVDDVRVYSRVLEAAEIAALAAAVPPEPP